MEISHPIRCRTLVDIKTDNKPRVIHELTFTTFKVFPYIIQLDKAKCQHLMDYLLIIYQRTTKWPASEVTDTPDDYRSARLVWNKTSQQEGAYNVP